MGAESGMDIEGQSIQPPVKSVDTYNTFKEEAWRSVTEPDPESDKGQTGLVTDARRPDPAVEAYNAQLRRVALGQVKNEHRTTEENRLDDNHK